MCGSLTIGADAAPSHSHTDYPVEYYAYRPVAEQTATLRKRVGRVVRRLVNPRQDRYLALLTRLREASAREAATVLDVGCGSGALLREMTKVGWVAQGLEPGEGGTTAQEAGFPVRRTRVEDAGFERGSFDLVVLNHVLEHLDDPRDVLRRVVAWLRPSGSVMVRVPVRDSWPARLFGRFWSQLDAPRHRVVFTRAAIRRLLRERGLVVHECFSDGFGFGFWGSLLYLFQVPLVRFPRSLIPVANLVFAPLAAVSNALEYGDQVTVLATLPARD